MKLFFSYTSPYARKCRIVAMEHKLDSKIELIAADPGNPKSGVKDVNPLTKIPVLILDDGSSLYDSPVICEYLDVLGGGGFFPPAGKAKWEALRRQALGDGIVDAAILLRYEITLRPENLRSKEWMDRQQTKVIQSLDALEADPLPSNIDIGTISIAAALDYIDFRFADMAWRNTRPKLARWHEAFSKRPSLQSTLPKD